MNHNRHIHTHRSQFAKHSPCRCQYRIDRCLRFPLGTRLSHSKSVHRQLRHISFQDNTGNRPYSRSAPSVAISHCNSALYRHRHKQGRLASLTLWISRIPHRSCTIRYCHNSTICTAYSMRLFQDTHIVLVIPDIVKNRSQ